MKLVREHINFERGGVKKTLGIGKHRPFEDGDLIEILYNLVEYKLSKNDKLKIAYEKDFSEKDFTDKKPLAKKRESHNFFEPDLSVYGYLDGDYFYKRFIKKGKKLLYKDEEFYVNIPPKLPEINPHTNLTKFILSHPESYKRIST